MKGMAVMAVTEESVQAKREKLAKLYADKDATEEKRLENERQVELELLDKQLDAEIAAAEAELARQKRIATKTAVREGAAVIADVAVEDAKESTAIAQAQADREGK